MNVIFMVKKEKYKQEFILITGTPHDEIQFILKKLRINDAFSKIFGSPNEKKAVVKEIKEFLSRTLSLEKKAKKEKKDIEKY